MTRARLNPQEPPYTDAIEARLARLTPPGRTPFLLFRTLARNPRVCERVMAGGLLDKGSIPMRAREIVIDRTCARCGAEYEWGLHATFFADRVGLTAEQLAASVHGGADDPAAGWPEAERVLLQLVDELHDTAGISDDLWQELTRHWSEEQLIELIAVAGFYHMISFLTNALRLPPEDDVARFPPASTAAGHERVQT